MSVQLPIRSGWLGYDTMTLGQAVDSGFVPDSFQAPDRIGWFRKIMNFFSGVGSKKREICSQIIELENGVDMKKMDKTLRSLNAQIPSEMGSFAWRFDDEKRAGTCYFCPAQDGTESFSPIQISRPVLNTQTNNLLSEGREADKLLAGFIEKWVEPYEHLGETRLRNTLEKEMRDIIVATIASSGSDLADYVDFVSEANSCLAEIKCNSKQKNETDKGVQKSPLCFEAVEDDEIHCGQDEMFAHKNRSRQNRRNNEGCLNTATPSRFHDGVIFKIRLMMNVGNELVPITRWMLYPVVCKDTPVDDNGDLKVKEQAQLAPSLDVLPPAVNYASAEKVADNRVQVVPKVDSTVNGSRAQLEEQRSGLLHRGPRVFIHG